MKGGSSYRQILRSSSIMGGAQVINYLVGLIKTKLEAILLGPSGVGLVGLYFSTTSLISTFSGLGIGLSGVREVAEAQGRGDPKGVAATVQTLRRVSWATGFLGLIVAVALSSPLSLWIFGSGERARAVAALGIGVLFSAVSAGEIAFLQGTRRIVALARLNVISVFVGAVVSVVLYSSLGERGIVPALVIAAGTNLVILWSFSRKIIIGSNSQSLAESWHTAKRLVALGFAFMWTALLSSAVLLGIRAVIVRELGLGASGLYQAAWAISGMFASFVLSAMGTDFYPRLAGVAGDPAHVNRLVNEQTEIGILIALPGLVVTLFLAPWVIQVLYSAQFAYAGKLLPWFVLGVYGQVVSWPMGYIIFAKGTKTCLVIVESVASVVRFGLSVTMLYWLGLIGTAFAFFLLYFLYTVMLRLVCKRVTGFQWFRRTWKVIGTSAALITVALIASEVLSSVLWMVVAALVSLIATMFSVYGIAQRLGDEHRFSRLTRAIRSAGRLWQS